MVGAHVEGDRRIDARLHDLEGLDDPAADEFHNADENDQNDYGHMGHVLHIPIVAVADCKVSQTAGSDHSGHGRQVQQADGGDGGAPCDGRDAFLQVNTENNLHGTGPHGQRRFNESGVQLRQSALHLTGEKGNAAEHQRDNGSAHINGGSHNGAGHRHDPCQQDNKGDGAKQAYQLIRNLINDFVFQNAARLRNREQHAKNQPQNKGNGSGPDNHQKRVANGGIKVRQLCHDIGNQIIQKLLHL